MTIKSLVTVTGLDLYIVGGYLVDTERGDYKWYTDVRNCNRVFIFFFSFFGSSLLPASIVHFGAKAPKK